MVEIGIRNPHIWPVVDGGTLCAQFDYVARI
jgi:hypothetical protein